MLKWRVARQQAHHASASERAFSSADHCLPAPLKLSGATSAVGCSLLKTLAPRQPAPVPLKSIEGRFLGHTAVNL